MKTITMTPAAKAPIKSAPASESMPLEGGAALDLYLEKINQNVEAIQSQLAAFKKTLDVQKQLLQDADEIQDAFISLNR